MMDTNNLSEFRSFRRVLPNVAAGPRPAGRPEELRVTDDLGNSLMRKMQGFFAALRMAERRFFQRPGSGCAMLRAKVCLTLLVAVLACVSTSSAQTLYCYPYSLSLYIQPAGTTFSAPSATCPPDGALYLWGSTDADVGIKILYVSGPDAVVTPCGELTAGGQCQPIYSVGFGIGLYFATSGEYSFQIQGLNGNGPNAVPMGSPGSFTVIVTTGIDPSNLGVCPQCQSHAGAPINLTTGNVWVQQRDYTVPGLGGGLEVVRTWNSLWQFTSPPIPAQAGMFGNSWRSTYEEVLTGPDSNNNFKYWRGDGSAWTFTYNSTLNSYSLISPPDVRAQLVSNLTGGFTLTLPDGTQKVFNGQNLLGALIDRNHNQTTLAYDTYNRLTSVSSPGGSTLTFTYGDPNNPNQATTAQDGVGTVATYTYDGSSRLTKVTYPDGSALNLTYDPNFSMLLSVTDSQGKLLESHTYDAQGRGLTSARAYGVDSVSLSY